MLTLISLVSYLFYTYIFFFISRDSNHKLLHMCHTSVWIINNLLHDIVPLKLVYRRVVVTSNE